MRGKPLASLGLLCILVAPAAWSDEPAKPRDPQPARRLEQELSALIRADRWDEAVQVAEELARLRERVQGAKHFQVVNAYGRVRTYRRIAALSREERAEFVSTGDMNQQARSLNDQGKYTAAQALHEKALEIRRRLLTDDYPETAQSYNNLAHNLWLQGRYTAAQPLYEKALEINSRLLTDDHPETALTYNNVAANFWSQGNNAAAQPLLERALEIRRRVLSDNHSDTVISYNNLACDLQAQGKYAAAQPLYEKALEINHRLRTDDHPLTALSYNNLASNLQAQGHYGAARLLQEKALEINRRLRGENHPDVATSFSNLAGNLREQGQYAAARPLFEKALELRRRLLGDDHPLTALSYNNQASNLQSLGECAAAQPLLEKTLELRRRLLTDDHPETATSYTNLAGNLQAQGHYAAAQPLFAKGLEIHRQLLSDDHPLTALGYGNLASNLNAQGKYREAIVQLARAARANEVSRLDTAVGGLDRAKVKRHPNASLLLPTLLARLGRGTEAWQRLEQQWGRGLLDELAARQDKRLTQEERDRLHTLVAELERLDRLFDVPMANSDQAERRTRLESLRQERARARIALGEMQTELVKKYGPLAGEVAPLTEVQAFLPADTALIAWVDVKPAGPDSADPDGEHWGVVVRAQGDPIWVKLQGTGKDQHWTQDDDALPGRVKNALQDQPCLGSTAWGPLVEQLYAQRLAPLATALAARTDGLPTARRLVVLPSAALSLVPVEALLPPGDPRTISYAPSATVLTYLCQQSHSDANAALLALGDPVFDPQPACLALEADRPFQQLLAGARAGDDATFARLPGTRLEVAALARLFEDAKRPVRVLLDNDANEPELDRLASSGALGEFGFIHLATHGVIDEQFPRRSAVILTQTGLPDPLAQVLAKEPVYDGRLVVREIQRDWNLRAELVTLSACETARGKLAGGEGFVGFTQALLLSGARSVCLSLWKVDDTATALLMRRFYANLLGVGTGRPRPKAEALAEAKAWLRGLGLGEAQALATQLSTSEPRGKGAAIRRPAMPADAVDDRPYAHPYYWASFVLIGDPD